MVLANLYPNSAENNDVNFTSNPAEFGTDNCATYHFWSDLRLFVKFTYRLIEASGVQGIAGKAFAKGVETVVFTVEYDNGIESKIRLDNIIHLPEASKHLLPMS